MVYTGGDDRFDWDDANVEHIRDRHGIEPWQVEEAFEDENGITYDARRVRGEQRRGILATTDAGRLLRIVYVRRGAAVRIVSARDASPREGRIYRRHSR